MQNRHKMLLLRPNRGLVGETVVKLDLDCFCCKKDTNILPVVDGSLNDFSLKKQYDSNLIEKLKARMSRVKTEMDWVGLKTKDKTSKQWPLQRMIK